MSASYDTPKANGHAPIADAEAVYNPTYIESDMPPTKDDRLIELLERRMDDDRRLSEERHKELITVLASGKDVTRLPNWLMPIACSVLFALLAFVYTTVDRRIEDLKRDHKAELERQERAHQDALNKYDMRLSTQEIFTQNTREKFIENGWTFTPDGKIVRKGR